MCRSKYDHVHRLWNLSKSGHTRVNLTALPNELLRDIADYLTKRDLKNIRGVCSRLQDFAAPLIFTTAICAARRGLFEVFIALSDHPKLNQHVTELIFDSSSFDHETVKLFESYATGSNSAPVSSTTPVGRKQHIRKYSTTPVGRERYFHGYREQTKILDFELSSALANAVREFTNLRRVIYADFGRVPCFRWDRVDDLGPDFRLGHLHVPEAKPEALQYPLLKHLEKDTPLRSMYLGLAVLLREFFRADCKTQVDDLRLGDSESSRGKGGIPDTLFMALFDGSYGCSTALFDSVRKLDVTFTYCTRCDHAKALPRFHHLQLLRLVGPMCSPGDGRYAPDLFEPVVRFPTSGEDTVWPQIRALELKWVASNTVDLLAFLKLHRDTLRFVNLYEVYLDERNQWAKLVSSLRSLYPNLTIEPPQRPRMDYPYPSGIIYFTLYEGQAHLTNMGVLSSTEGSIDDYDEDEVSNFHDDEKSLPESERWSSEDLDYSEDGAPTGFTSDEEECPIKHCEDEAV
ncbi:MAG: hypothetical protein LQ339_005181 [Xanthoria mediterranea]|nr:MAG: hypothetical protein LQ339_005181 [Xanthoria mediterranea]